MKKETIRGLNGYDIPCVNNLSGDERRIVIISHGLGSSKESPTAKSMASALTEHGIGTYSFDFPAHGDSPVDGEKFRISNCLNDLTAVEAHVRELRLGAEIAYFSSSFGAYINLIYLATRTHAGKKSFLRCAAVDMPRLFRNITSQEQYTQLREQGYIMPDFDYIRPLKFTREFYDDLEAHDVFKLCRPDMAEIAMIHGDADETASVVDARRFAKQFGARLTEVKGADHRIMTPGGLDRVIKTAVQFFKEN
ncbi:alpha/beta hydrolase [Desulfosporosinus sp.]|uniref:alpha/beta hydrolase n=1 Tax=Desulfosporosinus sp. TaxID=157907 RepID=UPI0025C2EB10|nr:alpha/beta hydrolase [Desulfosporosinus sp.]MBC2724629.1 alpha/beta hydrolase [Desulfosporosinus sp.]MBC2725275.1 alpha/beta hydrolase [Desulfosporosinus sp.]